MTKSNTQSIMDLFEIQRLREPRENENKLQTWSSNPTSSGSRKWPEGESEQSVDLRVDREENSWSRQLRVTWNSAKNKQSTTSTLLFIHWSWISRMSDEMLSSIRQKFKQLLPILTWHSKEREEPGMVLSHGKSISTLPKGLWEKSTRRWYIRWCLTAFKLKYFMLASYNIIDRRMVRKSGLHSNNRYYAQCLSRTTETIRSVVPSSVRSETHGESPNKKAPRLPPNNTGYCQHEQRSGADSGIEKTK